MAKQKSKHDKIVRCFEVSEPTLHPKGHTIYKIVQKLIPVDSPEKEVQQVIVWRRYNDIKKLYKAMLKLHNALHRKEEFPPFAAATMFGRFEKEVIIERQRCAQDLLNFVAQRSYFVKSKAFQEFFEGGECSSVADCAEVLKPLRVGEDNLDIVEIVGGQVSDLESLTTADLVTDWEITGERGSPLTDHILEAELNADSDGGLGGVWQYRQAGDNISLGGLDDEDDNTDFTDDSTLSTPLAGTDSAFFDPFHPLPTDAQGPSLKTANSGSNEWLLSTMEICGVSPGDEGTPTSGGTPDTSVILESEEPEMDPISPELPRVPTDDIESPTSFYIEAPVEVTEGPLSVNKSPLHILGDTTDGSIGSSQGRVQYGKGDLEFDPLRSFSTSDQYMDQTEKKATLAIPEKPLPKNLSLLNLDVQDKGDYIFQAANQISLGQQCEASANYHMAFNYIRNGVGILLTGVQLDENSARREVVRRKTAKYLQRAEKLHKKYLDGQGNQNLADRWDKGQVSPTKLLDPQAACIEGPLSELKNYKVIGVIDNVMLVIDSATDNTYVMKVLQKSSNSATPKRRNIVPTYCPCMVKLHRFYETKYALILVLQHAPGGTLWKYIGHYLHNSASQSEVHDLYLDSSERELKYAGRAVHNDTDCKPDPSVAVDKLAHHPQIKNNNPLTSDPPNDKVQISLDAGSSKVAYKAESNCVNSEIEPDIYEGHDFVSSEQDRINRNSNCNTKSNDFNPNDINTAELHVPIRTSPLFDAPEPLLLGQSPSQFQDLLKSTSSKPALEAFSVNSLDSDSGPTSRFESVTSDHIEVIHEVSENVSPTLSPRRTCLHSKSEELETVFSEDDSGSPDTTGCLGQRSRGLNETAGASFVSETDRMLAEVDKELEESNRAFHNLLHSEGGREADSDSRMCGVVRSHSTPNNKRVPGNHSTPNSKRVPGNHSTPSSKQVPGNHFTPSSKQVLSNVAETSIYDYRRSAGDSSSSTDSMDNLELSRLEGLDSEDREVEGINTLSNQVGSGHTVDNVSTLSTTHSSGGTGKKSDSVFRQVSQERSLETDNKPRNRSASGLSSVFDNLDMVSEDKRAAVTLPENSIRQWAAQVVTALEHLHELGIVCKDLSPDNLLLGDNGNVLLTYYCQWAQVERGVTQYSLDHFYTAPEVLGKGKHSSASDWWSLGVLLFELFTGKKLSSVYPFSITSHTQLEIPGDLSTEAQSLLTELLKYNPCERLGAGGGGVEEIKTHPFFSDIDWNTIAKAVQ